MAIRVLMGGASTGTQPGSRGMVMAEIDQLNERLDATVRSAERALLSAAGFGSVSGIWRSPSYYLEGVGTSRMTASGWETIQAHKGGERKAFVRMGREPSSEISPAAVDVPEQLWLVLESVLKRNL